MIKFGVVGLGHIAKKHIEAILKTPGAELVSLCDKDENRINLYDPGKYKLYTDFESMLEGDVDAVCICTPSGLHARLAIQAAKYRKHVIVEKPMALGLEEAKSIIEACKKNNVKLAVVHPNRFRPAVKELRKQLDNGLFGKIGHANATVRWNRNDQYYEQAPWRGTKDFDGGVLMNQAIHNIDLLVWLMGPVEEVTSYSGTRIRKIEAEDTSVSVIKFKNGALGVIEAAVTVYPENLEESLSIFAEKGTAVVSGKTANWIKAWEFSEEGREESDRTVQKVNDDPFGIPGHEVIIEDFVESIEQDRPPLVTGMDGYRALELVLACYKSAESGKSVNINSM